jgi:hypothetical protein
MDTLVIVAFVIAYVTSCLAAFLLGINIQASRSVRACSSEFLRGVTQGSAMVVKRLNDPLRQVENAADKLAHGTMKTTGARPVPRKE